MRRSCSGKAVAVCCPLVKYLKHSCAARIMQASQKCSTHWPWTEAVSHTDHKRPFSKMLMVLWLWLQKCSESGFSSVENLSLSSWDFLIRAKKKKTQTLSFSVALKESDISFTQRHTSLNGALPAVWKQRIGITQGDFPIHWEEVRGQQEGELGSEGVYF